MLGEITFKVYRCLECPTNESITELSIGVGLTQMFTVSLHQGCTYNQLQKKLQFLYTLLFLYTTL